MDKFKFAYKLAKTTPHKGSTKGLILSLRLLYYNILLSPIIQCTYSTDTLFVYLLIELRIDWIKNNLVNSVSFGPDLIPVRGGGMHVYHKLALHFQVEFQAPEMQWVFLFPKKMSVVKGWD